MRVGPVGVISEMMTEDGSWKWLLDELPIRYPPYPRFEEKPVC